MKRSRFTEEQIIGILKEQEAGQRTAAVCLGYVRDSIRKQVLSVTSAALSSVLLGVRRAPTTRTQCGISQNGSQGGDAPTRHPTTSL